VPLLKIERQGHVAVLTIDRPEMMNALTQDGDGVAFRDACDAINADTDIRCVILTGAGKAFSAGGDVKAMKAREGAFAGIGVDVRQTAYRGNVHLMLRALDSLDVPMIAAVNGAAIGLGCDLACLADIRIASDQARFGVTFLKIGLIPGDGGAWVLPRIIGMSRAAELLYTGDMIDAATACAWGLVSRVTPHADLADEAMALAQRIALQPPHALRMTKMLLRQGRNVTYDTLLEMSAATQALAHMTEDHIEGVSALLEKRPADFKGK
jgi:enoyl-CoA hydratase/carnithine racemase